MAEEVQKKAASAEAQGIDEVKGIAALAYLIFFVPLLTHPDNAFAKYHANQGLNLLLLAIAVNVVGGLIPIIGWFIIVPLGNIAVLVLFILGLINALNGQKKPLPLIGSIELLK